MSDTGFHRTFLGVSSIPSKQTHRTLDPTLDSGLRYSRGWVRGPVVAFWWSLQVVPYLNTGSILLVGTLLWMPQQSCPLKCSREEANDDSPFYVTRVSSLEERFRTLSRGSVFIAQGVLFRLFPRPGSRCINNLFSHLGNQPPNQRSFEFGVVSSLPVLREGVLKSGL